jgi:8-oxo-dGTP pyrophosphatase MutT (NUDIX family)
MKHSTQIINAGGKSYHLTWAREDNVTKYAPITHVHGIIFNDAGEILIGRSQQNKPWTILGGKVEVGETVEQTLRRELMEEGNVTVGRVYNLGIQKVEVPDDPIGEKNPYFQVRCVALLNELLPRAPDPDAAAGTIWERMFVPSKDIEQYILWGENGHAMFEEAIALYATELSKKATT